MTFRHYVAVDLDTSSGRIMLACYDSEHRSLTLRGIHHFISYLQKTDDFDTWDIDSLEDNIRLGLKRVCDGGIQIDSIGIDTWGVNYVLIDSVGQRIDLPVSYRNSRTIGIMAQVMEQPGRGEIYRRNGIQFLPFNTLYQPRALVEWQPELLPQVAHALLIPDYFSFRLTSKMSQKYTDATTTQLANINTDDQDDTLLTQTGADKAWFGRPTHPRNVIGHWICPQRNQIPIVAVAGYSTTNAVVASPPVNKNSAYLFSGTWSLMGFESRTPYTNDAALTADITNEDSAEGRYRVLKNIMGLQLPQRVLKERQITDLTTLISRTQALSACQFLISSSDDRFINPDDMSAEIQTACRESGQPIPLQNVKLACYIFDSLALLYADIPQELARLRNVAFNRLHIVGGGCQSTLLDQLCVGACGIRVMSGPTEASTLGNIDIQLMTLDGLNNVDDFRQVVRANYELTIFIPNPESETTRYQARLQSLQQTEELCA